MSLHYTKVKYRQINIHNHYRLFNHCGGVPITLIFINISYKTPSLNKNWDIKTLLKPLLTIPSQILMCSIKDYINKIYQTKTLLNSSMITLRIRTQSE